MSRKTKLQAILKSITPDETKVDFAQFDSEVSKLKDSLKEKITVKTLDDVNNQLDKFRKRISFEPLQKSIEDIKTSSSTKIDELNTSLQSKLLELHTLILEGDKFSTENKDNLETEIGDLKTQLSTLEEVRKKDVSTLNIKLGDITKVSDAVKLLENSLKENTATLDKEDKQNKKELETQVKNFTDELEKMRKELITRINSKGGGSMNQRVQVNGTTMSTKFADFNLKGSGITVADNATTNQVDIDFTGLTGGDTLAAISTNSLTTPNSLYTMSAGIPVEFKTSGGTHLLYLDETNGRVGIGTANPGNKLDVAGQTGTGSTGVVHITGYDQYGQSIVLQQTGSYTGSLGLTFKGDSNAMGMSSHFTSGSPDYYQFTNIAGNSLFTILQTGNVGIGTTGPDAKLHIAGTPATTVGLLHLDAAASANPLIRLENYAGTGGAGAAVGIWGDIRSSDGTATQLRLDNGGTTNFVVQVNGNVGIGVTNPLVKLDISGTADTSTTGFAYNLNLFSSNTAAQNVGGGINFGGSYTGTTQTTFASISGIKENGIDADFNGALQFVTRTGAGGPQFNERMRITSSGNVGIGTTNPSAKLEVVGTNPSVDITDNSGTPYRWRMAVVSARNNNFEINNNTGVINPFVITTAGAITIGNNGINSPGSGTLTVYDETTSTGATSVLIQGGAAAADATTNNLFRINQGGGTTGLMVVQGSGNVGIGTTGPNDLLTVSKSQTAETIIGVTNINTGAGAYSGLRARNSVSAAALLMFGTGYSPSGLIRADGAYLYTGGAGGLTITTEVAQPIYFGINNAEKMRIDTNGNVGIGTTGPASKLDILDTTLAGSGALAGSILNLAQTWNTSGTPTAIKLNVTNTASNAASLLMDLQVGTVTKFNIGLLGTINTAAKIGTYNAIATAGWGVPVIYGSGRVTGQTAANASVATYTLPATDGSFKVVANVLVTTSSAEAFTVTVDYTDEGNTARTVTLNFSLVAGTIGTAINFANGAVPYMGIPIRLRCKASTAITVKTAAGGVYTGCTYNCEASIIQLS